MSTRLSWSSMSITSMRREGLWMICVPGRGVGICASRTPVQQSAINSSERVKRTIGHLGRAGCGWLGDGAVDGDGAGDERTTATGAQLGKRWQAEQSWGVAGWLATLPMAVMPLWQL